MTNDSVVADAFRPYRCARDHNYASAGSRHSLGTQEHDRQFCEVFDDSTESVSSPSRPTRAKTTHDAGSKRRRRPRGRLGASTRTSNQQSINVPTETQIKMVNQYHRNLGHPSRREFLKVLKAAHAKPAVLEYVRREHRCADCDAHTKPQPSRKAAIPRTCEFNSHHCPGRVLHSIARTISSDFEHHLS